MAALGTLSSSSQEFGIAETQFTPTFGTRNDNRAHCLAFETKSAQVVTVDYVRDAILRVLVGLFQVEMLIRTCKPFASPLRGKTELSPTPETRSRAISQQAGGGLFAGASIDSPQCTFRVESPESRPNEYSRESTFNSGTLNFGFRERPQWRLNGITQRVDNS